MNDILSYCDSTVLVNKEINKTAINIKKQTFENEYYFAKLQDN